MMNIHASGEDYLEAILVLQKKKVGFVLLTLLCIWVLASQASAMR